ncbi:MAG: hypothetical protein JO317_06490, partial [Verrucomicrobiae bacterium]|nr:hypothetical protein [Verrucomicrobiae bacterium]
MSTPTLPFAGLEPYEPRRFVPADADLGDWAQIEPLLDELEARLDRVRTREDLEAWLRLNSEF